ncbi:phosphopantetheine-binding protein [Streptomyces sp. NPDC007157]|uniref:acyl carrier protein n=1 Tax=Streptomyces sp. NPDC007157 TaxID=3154681 RepID=UPI0034097BF2
MTMTDDVHAQALKLARTYLGQDGLDGGWFELGGSSLDAARLVSSLEHDHGWEIALQDLLTAPSVAELLAAPVTPAASEASESPAAPAPAPAAAAPSAQTTGSAPGAPAPAEVAATPAASSGVDVLWPALARLSAADRLALAHRLLGEVLRESGDRH